MRSGERFMCHSLLAAPLNLGLLGPGEWRELVRGVFGLRRARWARANALRARRPLPEALRTGRSEMRCVAEAVGGARATWFQASFVDGHEWVMAPNVLGMALWADGGGMTTKPYAAGGSYVSRMSDHCGGCRYDPRRRTGPDACPLTTLSWDFLHRHRRRLSGNPRMSLAYRTLDRLSPDERAGIARRAAALREALP